MYLACNTMYWYVFLFQKHADTYLHRAVSSRNGLLARRRAVAAHSPRSRCGKLVALNKFIWIRSARLGSGRQLEQQRLCYVLNCPVLLVASGLPRGYRETISISKIIIPVDRFDCHCWTSDLGKTWISWSTCTPKSKHRKSTQTSTMFLRQFENGKAWHFYGIETWKW